MKPRSLALTAGLLLSHLLSFQARAQTPVTLVDWSHTWNYMHPTAGALPAGSGPTTPHPTGTTPWFAAEAAFAGSYTGPSFATGGAGYEAGAGAGPLGYGTLEYTGTPLPPPAEFTAFGTTLATPATGSRRTGYFRTTFTVPNDGNFYVNPVLRYLLDDGGFVYIDGVLVLRVNVAGGDNDDYTVVGANTTNNETHIRDASLSLGAGSVTGGNTAVAPAIAGNATVVQSVFSLAPGVHTLAVSAHNAATDSSDLSLAVQLVLTQTDCAVAGVASNVTRDTNGTPDDAFDDTISFTMNVTPVGTVSASWTVAEPFGSATVGQGGSYNSNVAITDVPIFEFAGGFLPLVIEDSGAPSCRNTVNVTPQWIIASNNLSGGNLPIVTTGTVPPSGWVFDDTNRTLSMNNGGGGARKVVTSEVVDLSSEPATLFSGVLQVNDTSSGTEAPDSFVAYLVIDGNAGNPINLITPYDTQVVDGVLSDDELAPVAGFFEFPLRHVLRANVNSVQVIVEGINDSGNEFFTVRDLTLGVAPPTVQATAGAVVFNNQGTADAGDDTFTAPVTVEGINVGASTGWTSDATPAAGNYASPQPVVFGPFAATDSPRSVTLTDNLDGFATTTISLTVPARTFTASAPTNIARIENGPGLDDDTVTFDVAIAGTFGGPGWATTTPGVSPASGGFGTVTFTVGAPLPLSPLNLFLEDASYPLSNQTVAVNLPGRYLIGQVDLGGGPSDLATDVAVVPAAQWINDPLLRTLQLNNGGGQPDKVVVSDLINLTGVGAVGFTATLRAVDSSTGTSMESNDRFKAELVYEVGGLPTTVNLVGPYDTGDGSPSTTGLLNGANGPANGYLNGYSGAIGTDLESGAVYATVLEDYDAHPGRDEFNSGLAEGAALYDNLFALGAAIPASADNVRLIISGANDSASETFSLTDVLFSTSTVVLDTDGDGMSDAYEDANGLNKNNPADKFLDLDGDGQANYHEFLAGTAANSSASVLKVVAVSKTGSTATVTWRSVPGKTYRIDIGAGLTTWTDIGADFPAASAQTSSGPLDLTGIGNPPVQYLRVRVKP